VGAGPVVSLADLAGRWAATRPIRNGALRGSLLGTLGGTLVIAACGAHHDRAAAGGAATTKVIGVTLLTREQRFYQDLDAGLEAAAARRGYRLIVTSGDFDLAKQQAQIDNFVVQRVDAIVVCPVNSQGVGPAIDRATAAHIPVVSADTKAVGTQVVAAVASDNRAGGQLAAAYMVTALGDSGAVAVIGQPETQTGLDRQQAFVDEIGHHPRMAVVAILNGGGVRDRALKAADDILQGHPELRGIFAINDESALGALAAARARGRAAATFTIVGYDATPEAVQAIKSHSSLKADIAQQPRAIGEKAIDAIAARFDHRPVDSVITVPVRIIDAETP
jgi:ribose transport system substrate-binding protein